MGKMNVLCHLAQELEHPQKQGLIPCKYERTATFLA